MSLLNILQHPDPRLKKIASPVTISDISSKHIQTIIDNMFETMYQANGVGLAAIQVNIPLQIITIDVSEPQNTPLCFINPNILAKQDTVTSTEGCLSFPGIYAKIKRYKTIDVEFLDDKGHQQSLHCEEMLSICLQHEIDHLHGKTFFDHLSLLKKTLLEKKLQKLRKHNL